MIKDGRKIQPGTVDCKGFYGIRESCSILQKCLSFITLPLFYKIAYNKSSMVSILFTLLGRAF